MKRVQTVLSLTVLFSALTAFGEKPVDSPACSAAVKACEAAGYEPGDHKKNGKGLWVDCIHAIAKGKTVAGVSVSQADAKACMEAAKAHRKQK